MVESSSASRQYREVLVQPKAALREALILVGMIVLIILLMSVRFSLIGSKDTRAKAQSYQINNLNLKAQAPVIYRALLGVVADVVDLREEAGNWPDVNTLKEEALPPFADVFLPNGLRGFAWEKYEGAGWVDYYGINTTAATDKREGGDPLENSFILRIIDLHNDAHPHPHFGEDSNKQIRFTAQIWINPQIIEHPGVNLIERGWKWIITNSSIDENVLSEQPGQ